MNLFQKYKVLCLWMSTCALGAAQATTVLQTASPYGNAPQFMAADADDASPARGLCIDILRAIERIAPTLRFQGDQRWMPPARIEAELSAGIQDAAPCLTRSPERESRMVFLEPALFQLNFSLAVRADDNVTIRSWADVRAMGMDNTVLAVQGSNAASRARVAAPGLRFDTEAATPELNLRKLVARRGRFFYHPTSSLRQEIARTGLQGTIKLLTPPLDSAPVYLALGRHLPKTTADRLRQALQQLHNSGELASLAEKWDNQ